MTNLASIELLVLKCAVLKTEVEKTLGRTDDATTLESQSDIVLLLGQVAHDVRVNAEKMAEYYKIFYLLENDIRQLIDETLTEVHGAGWWDSKAPPSAKDECK